MDRNQILAVIAQHRREYNPRFHTEILFIRGHHIWWLHRKLHGEFEIELSEYGVN